MFTSAKCLLPRKETFWFLGTRAQASSGGCCSPFLCVCLGTRRTQRPGSFELVRRVCHLPLFVASPGLQSGSHACSNEIFLESLPHTVESSS